MNAEDSATEQGPVKADGEGGATPVAAAADGTVKFCPNCDKPLPDGATLCTECGFNLLTGEPVEAPVGTGAADLSRLEALQQAVLDFFPGLYYPGIILLALLCAGVACFLAVFTVFVFALGAYLSALAIGVATLAVWMQAVTLMCVGRAEFFNTALGDIEGTQFGVFIGLVLAPPVAVWAFLGWLSATSKG